MHKTAHAQDITRRFREMVEAAGHTLPVEHYDELSLLIEAGIDTVLVERLEKIADELQKMSRKVRNEAENFE